MSPELRAVIDQWSSTSVTRDGKGKIITVSDNAVK